MKAFENIKTPQILLLETCFFHQNARIVKSIALKDSSFLYFFEVSVDPLNLKFLDFY